MKNASGDRAKAHRYAEFIDSKILRDQATGKVPAEVHPSLYPFQSAIVRWAIRRGRAAIFAGTGLGKTRMQLEFARQMGKRALIVAPLAVAEQTIAEAAKMGLEVTRVARPEFADGVHITNYQKLHHFVGAPYDALVLDESSILKSVDGKTRSLILEEFTNIPSRLACTATPAPNDIAELANHAEFLGVMRRVEMLSTFFVHDESEWRLKGHGSDAFYRWLASWAVYLRQPSDLAFEDAGFELPPLTVTPEIVHADWKPDGMLFAAGIGGVGGRSKARRGTMDARIAKAVELIADTRDQWLVWVGLNDEGRMLAKTLGEDAVVIEGKDEDDAKTASIMRWVRGEGPRVLVSKTSIFGFGLNLQNCHRMLFLGLSDSWESYFQAIRRCWRFGQQSPVDVRVVTSTAEVEVLANVRAKEATVSETMARVVEHMKDVQREQVCGTKRETDPYIEDEASGDGWTMKLGDAVTRVKEIQTGSVGLSVYSPPFASLYCYSNSPRDMGNSRDYDEFFRHYGFLVAELMRVTMPGRRAAVHCQQVSTTLATHGRIGWRDFRGHLIASHEQAGWIYDGEVCIDKDPQAQAIRTHSKQLMFVQKARDQSWLRPAMADYILLFRAPGENPTPVVEQLSNDEWIEWARPIWYGIRESDTLQVAEARSDKDEKHICPLQLGTIERCIRLWTNPGDLVFSPFAGIGSEGYVALKHDRRFVGIELKRAYYDVARKNLGGANRQVGFFFAASGAA